MVHRSDGSGTNFLFTNYLSKVSAEWKSKVGADTSVEWPVGIGAKGNEGVANMAKQTEGAIGYVEYAYAKQNKLTYAKLVQQGRQGRRSPSLQAFQAAAARRRLGQCAQGYYLILTDQPGADGWPITGASFILDATRSRPTRRRCRGPQVLRLGLQGRHGDGHEARLRADAATASSSMVEKTWTQEIKGGGARSGNKRPMRNIRASTIA